MIALIYSNTVIENSSNMILSFTCNASYGPKLICIVLFIELPTPWAFFRKQHNLLYSYRRTVTIYFTIKKFGKKLGIEMAWRISITNIYILFQRNTCARGYIYNSAFEFRSTLMTDIINKIRNVY